MLKAVSYNYLFNGFDLTLYLLKVIFKNVLIIAPKWCSFYDVPSTLRFMCYYVVLGNIIII